MTKYPRQICHPQKSREINVDLLSSLEFYSISLKRSQRVELGIDTHGPALLTELLERGQLYNGRVERIVILYRKWNCLFRTQENYLNLPRRYLQRERRPSG